MWAWRAIKHEVLKPNISWFSRAVAMISCGEERMDYAIRCFGCSSIVSRRARESMLLSNEKIKLYSASTPTESVRCVRSSYMAYSCRCIVVDVECRCCRMVLGYHILHPCELCVVTKTSGHTWVFDTSSVISTAREGGPKTYPDGAMAHYDEGDHEVKIR